MASRFSLFKSMALVVLLSVTACIPAPRAADLTPPSFHGKPQIALDVADIQVRNDYQPQGNNHVEQRFRTTPAQGVEIWARDRLKAAGQSGVLEVVILDAGVVETSLATKEGIQGALTKEPSARYDGTLEVELRLYTGDRATSKAHVRAKAEVDREILEKASLSQHDELYAAMTRDLLTKLDRSLEQGIREYFGNYTQPY